MRGMNESGVREWCMRGMNQCSCCGGLVFISIVLIAK